MSKIIDAMGKACPMPVIMAKKEIETNRSDFIITVDNEIAVENLKKLALNKQYHIAVSGNDMCFELQFTAEGSSIFKTTEEVLIKPKASTPKEDWVVFMGKDHIGEGDFELGNSLAKMFFYTLAEAETVPESILFMNSGVKLVVEDEQIVGHLKMLADKGVEILVCGTCLDYYKIKDNLKIGTISNMYDITEKMFAAAKVITL